MIRHGLEGHSIRTRYANPLFEGAHFWRNEGDLEFDLMVSDIAHVFGFDREVEAVDVTKMHEVEGVSDAQPGGDFEEIRSSRVKYQVGLVIVTNRRKLEAWLISVIGPDESKMFRGRKAVYSRQGRNRAFARNLRARTARSKAKMMIGATDIVSDDIAE